MLLQLRYNENALHTPCALLITGSSPAAWLNEIALLGLDPHHAECYAVPESIRSIKPCGLFVILKNGAAIQTISHSHLYGCIGNKLYVPVNASLYPEVSSDEMSKLLLWDRQVFHPNIGLIGFEKSDAIDLADLFSFTEPLASRWSFAHPGLEPKKQLEVIKVIPPTANDVIDDFKEALDTKPLSDIPKANNEPSSIQKFADRLKRGALKGVKAIIDLVPEGPPSASPGLLNHLDNWVVRNLDELERRRNAELNRLLNMFDENMEEALRYAIPLDSHHFNRGTASPSWQLSARNTNFNLNGLRGGQKVDAWDIGSHYSDLRSKYLAAAQKAINAKDFKKAAYIYAHLLGDHHSAANALEQGKHFREAAALYKDHLKNLVAAAECLERGGLIHEAIELYTEMNRYEKAGDLCKSIGQPDRAEWYYERTIGIALAGNHHIEAARLMADKLEQTARARETLLNGWEHGNQPEPCLKRYFELGAKEGSLSHEVQHIYVHHTPASKRKHYLEALAHINKLNDNEELHETSRTIAYNIISEEASEGKLDNLNAIKNFLPADKLISSDCSRFANNYLTRPKRSRTAASMQLDKETKWITALAHRSQFLALGIKSSKLHLARSDWYGNTEYYSWPHTISPGEQLRLIGDPFHSNRIFIHSTGEHAFEEKRLEKNTYFNDELVVGYPAWLPKNLLGLGFKASDGIIAVTDAPITTNIYSVDGKLGYSTGWKTDTGLPIDFGPHKNFSEAIFRSNRLYLNLYVLCQVNEDGRTHALPIDGEVRIIAATDHYVKFALAVSTDSGCLLFLKEKDGLRQSGEPFGKDLEPVDMLFISATHLVVAEKYKAVVFDLPAGMKPKYEFETKAPIKAILTTADRHQFALLEETGKVVMCKVGEV